MKPFQNAILVALLIMLFPFLGSGQKYADKSYYLIDSLKLDDLTVYDRELLDTSLVLYHNTTDDTIELAYLEHIVDNCWHPDVWPKYNRFMLGEIERMLTVNHSKKVHDKELYFLAGAISNLGYYHDENGNLMKALDYYHEALKIYESINNIQGAATTFNNLGVMYSVIGDTSRAVEYHTKSLEYKKELKDLEGVAMSYNNIGTIYENAADYFTALEYYEASLKIRLEINDLRGIAMSYDNVGDIYFKEEVYGKASEYYHKSYSIWTDLGIETGITNSMNNLAKLYFQVGEYEKAKEYGVNSYLIAKEINFPVDIENASRTLIKVFKREGDFEAALEYAMIYINIRETIRGERSAEIALQKSMQYQYEKLALKDSIQHQKERIIQEVTIKKQQTQAYGLYVGLGLLLIILILGIRSYRQKQRDNLKINEQKQEVEKQKTEIENQHTALAKTHAEISSSIGYAKRIQDAILPIKEVFKEILPQSFVLYLPKDVVSGDFYWLVNKDDHILFAVADCTGHGVPGAMVSVVCNNALNRAVKEFNLTEPAAILNKSREMVKETFEAKDDMVKDGMDITLCCLNKKTGELQWAGANNPLYYITSNSKEIEEIRPDKQPIGKFYNELPFTNHQLALEKNDMLYLFTDGYVDQFGGPNGKKFKHAKFKELLFEHHKSSMQEQKKALEDEFYRWKDDYIQIDDICVIGVKI